MSRFLSITILVLLAITGYSQSHTIKGKVTDATGSPLPGATIQVKGTTTGTVTDLNGVYQLNASPADILVVSFIGFDKQEIAVGNQTEINFALAEQASLLNEVVVIGYGTQKRKDVTTAVSVVGEKEMKDRPIVSAAQALQGKAAGVQVITPSGKPGENPIVRVRGATSLECSNDPLYVVDGVPTTDISGINPSDITSFTILKDASSSAIYGARSANGVVLISTKRGESGTPVVSYNSYFGFSKLRKTIDVLDTKQYRELMEEIMPGSVDPTWTYFNDWPDLVFGTGNTMSHQLSISGGSEKTKYYFGIGYLSENGMIKPAKFDRYNLRTNLDNQVNKWLKITTSINLSCKNTKDTPDNLSSGRGGVIMSTLNTPPFLHIYKQDGSGWYDPNPFQPSWENPYAYMYAPDQKSIDYLVFGNIGAEISILKNLIYKTSYGFDMANHSWDYYLDPIKTNYGRNSNGTGQSDKYTAYTWLFDNTLDYSYQYKKHSFTGMIGSSLQQYTYNNSYISGSDFPADTNVRTLGAANIISASTNRDAWSIASFFTRFTYDFDKKYYASFSVRRDGSSKLWHHWGTMPAFSLGWRISSEPFMKNIRWIDDLKLRGGWGKNGNQEGIPNYSAYGLYGYNRITPGEVLTGPGSYLATSGNPGLKWETTTQYDLGFDLSMLNSRINVTFDVYYKKTNDVILRVPLPANTGLPDIVTNAGSLDNKGIELNINSVNVDKKWRWSTDFNFSINRNEVLSLISWLPSWYTLPYGHIYSNNQDATRFAIGYPLGTFYGFIAEGVDPETGNMIYKDLNGDGVINPSNDRTKIGDPNPDFIFGITNSFSYKRWDLNIFFQGSVGNDIFNATRIDLEGMFDSKNQSTAVLNRWTESNRYTDIPKANGDVSNYYNSTRFIEDGTYVRLKSLTLSYRLIDETNKKFGISKLSLYVTGTNLLTFTGYSGFDPEVNAYGNNAIEMGIDYGTYPQSQSLIFGVNVEF